MIQDSSYNMKTSGCSYTKHPDVLEDRIYVYYAIIYIFYMQRSIVFYMLLCYKICYQN